ncbi:CaiB/BaiF CoA transferase family protein [Chloroflexota bacterium]
MNGNEEGLLGGYRLLDLTEGNCMFGGKILADMGADVVKIERPGGSPSRNIAPFYKNKPGIDRSLSWFAYNANKRGITLNLELAQGRDIFKQLVKSADILMESSQSGSEHLATKGLGYSVLSQVNPRLIVVSITPFGLTGPKAKYHASDLTTWASSGMLYICGEADGVPTWVSYPQASLWGGAYAALGTLIALWHRHLTDAGQQVDVSIQASCIKPTAGISVARDVSGVILQRQGPRADIQGRKVHRRVAYSCKDGSIGANLYGGSSIGSVNSLRHLVEWMDEEGMAPEWLKEFDWAHDYDVSNVTQEVLDRVEAQFVNFFKLKTKAELMEQAIKRGIFIAPGYNAKEVVESEQLEARKFWEKVKHDDLNDTVTYCGALAKVSGPTLKIRRRAPAVGEHNEEIYCGELGLSPEELINLQQADVL